MMDTNKNFAASRRRFLSVVGAGALLALGAGARAMQVRARQAQAVSPDEVRAFSRDFAVMLDEGQPLVTSLDMLADRQDNPEFQRVIRQINAEIAQGATLSREMAKFPLVFNAAYIATMREGEYYGTLEESMHQLAQSA